MTFDQIKQVAYDTKYWTKQEDGTLVDNSYLPEFVEACHQFKLKEDKNA